MNKTKVESGIKMANEIEKRERQFLGLPMVLIWGYIAVAIFMTETVWSKHFYLNIL